MINKQPICHNRIRKVPKQFSWVDHRLVRERYIDRCSPCAAALYLFLVTVADAQGISYYSDTSILKRLSMIPTQFIQARNDLMRIGLIAYRKPLYQVLAIGEPSTLDDTSLPKNPPQASSDEVQHSSHPQTLNHILKPIMENIPHD